MADEYFVINHMVSIGYQCDTYNHIVVKGRFAVANYLEKVQYLDEVSRYKVSRFLDEQCDQLVLIGDIFPDGTTYHMAIVHKLSSRPEI